MKNYKLAFLSLILGTASSFCMEKTQESVPQNVIDFFSQKLKGAQDTALKEAFSKLNAEEKTAICDIVIKKPGELKDDLGAFHKNKVNIMEGPCKKWQEESGQKGNFLGAQESVERHKAIKQLENIIKEHENKISSLEKDVESLQKTAEGNFGDDLKDLKEDQKALLTSSAKDELTKKEEELTKLKEEMLKKKEELKALKSKKDDTKK